MEIGQNWWARDSGRKKCVDLFFFSFRSVLLTWNVHWQSETSACARWKKTPPVVFANTIFSGKKLRYFCWTVLQKSTLHSWQCVSVICSLSVEQDTFTVVYIHDVYGTCSFRKVSIYVQGPDFTQAGDSSGAAQATIRLSNHFEVIYDSFRFTDFYRRIVADSVLRVVILQIYCPWKGRIYSEVSLSVALQVPPQINDM